MKKFIVLGLAILVSAFLLLPIAVNATPVPATVKYLGTGIVDVRNAGSFFASAGTYRIELNGVEMFVMCDDVTATIHSGQSWGAWVWGWSDIGSTPGKFDAILYSQAAYLYDQTYGETNSTILADIDQAIWSIMSPGAGIILTQAAQKYFTEAKSNPITNWSNIMEVITPNSGCAGQEFLKPVAPVPEPATILLLGAGLIGLAGLGRKKVFKKA